MEMTQEEQRADEQKKIGLAYAVFYIGMIALLVSSVIYLRATVEYKKIEQLRVGVRYFTVGEENSRESTVFMRIYEGPDENGIPNYGYWRVDYVIDSHMKNYTLDHLANFWQIRMENMYEEQVERLEQQQP